VLGGSKDGGHLGGGGHGADVRQEPVLQTPEGKNASGSLQGVLCGHDSVGGAFYCEQQRVHSGVELRGQLAAGEPVGDDERTWGRSSLLTLISLGLLPRPQQVRDVRPHARPQLRGDPR
jgi:hypothetical protein